MILEFFRFELRQQLRSPLFWLIAGLFALLAFAAGSSNAVQIGGAIGNVHRNAPTVVATFLTGFTLLGMLVITIFINGALLRDFEQGTAELFFASPIRKRDYLAGRLGAALAVCLLVYAGVGASLFVAQFMPWIDQARLGPASLSPYLWTYAVMVVPNLLFTGALLALLAAVTRSILWVYIGVVGFFVLYTVSRVLMADLDSVWLASLLDPLGIRPLARTIRYWSADERNNGLPAVAGYILGNRALWTAIALALFAATFALFSTRRSGTGGRRGFGGKAPATAPVAPAHLPASVPRVTPATGALATWRQFLRQLRFDTLGVLRGVPFLVMLVLGMANFLPAALLRQSLYGTEIHPVTSQMLKALQGSSGLLLLIIVIFHAGELVWKERTAKIHEVTDATPVPDWVPLLAKFAALVAVVLSFQLAGAAVAILVQLSKGHTQLELPVYATTLLLNAIPFVQIGGLALCLQVFCNSKFAGYGLMLLVLVAQAAMGSLDFTHNLYLYSGAPDAPYSDMNGYGHFLAAQLWFQSYWGLFLAGLLVLASALWVRGVGGGGRQRLALARRRLRGRTGLGLAAIALAFTAVGGFLFWNTNIRNDYRAPDERLDLRARYEREYGKYRDLPQPKIVATDIDADLRPETQSLRVDGRYTVVNPHAAPIRDIHVQMGDDRALASIDMGGASLVHHDVGIGYRIYRLERPLQPGGEREIRFRLDYHATGISNDGAQHALVENGSFFSHRMFPSFGYEADGQIADRNERRKRGLGEPSRMPKLEDVAARNHNYISDDGDWVDFRTTICTAPDQVALAPGYLEREFTRDGRRCFRYTMDRPTLHFYAFLSARWQVRRDVYAGHDGPVAIEVYHDPRHAYNVERMVEAVRKSLAYYEANFTPYQHRQVRIVEFPGYAGLAQSFANTIPYSESIGFIADLRDEDAIDYVFYVTAHEVAHQWWGHQVVGANVQGATVLSESLSQYSALMVMEREYGRAKMRRFLRHELDSYLSGRGGERVEELPLYRVENQQYVHYNKGSLVFYRLREEIGEAALNRALKKFLQDKGFRGAPYATSAELLDYIRAEAGPARRQLVADLFEKIGFYDNRVEAATARRRADGRYEVTLDLHAAKRYADGEGRDTAGRLDDWIEVGVFARGPSGEEADEKTLYLERHRITSEEPRITVVVDQEPHEAGFDPYNKLIDRVSGDNRKRISL